ncbi:iron siderophore-binding protein [Paenibacillus sp. J31TS4]|nr:iron siderophore-binding protein [Paenibacillus sp. J31TS4]
MAVLMVLVLALTAVGCGAKEEAAPGASGTTGGSESSGPYTVKHAMGTTKIPATPKKVVILTNEGTEALLAMGIKPVGAVNSYVGDPWYPHIKDKMKDVTPLGKEDQPNLEAIAALQPDLIIGNKMRQEKVYEQLSAIAPTVFSETLRGDWKENFKLYAEALNRKAEGDKVMADFTANVNAFKEKAGDKLNTKVSVVRFMPGKIRIYYKDTFTGVLFKELGLKRPASQDKEEFAAEVSKERVPEMDGDVLFYFTYDLGDGKGKQVEQELLNDPLWKNLPVVKNNKAFKVDDTIWNTSGGVLSANQVIQELYQYLDIKK